MIDFFSHFVQFSSLLMGKSCLMFVIFFGMLWYVQLVLCMYMCNQIVFQDVPFEFDGVLKLIKSNHDMI